MSSFELDLAKFGQKALDNAEQVVRKISLDMHSRIVERTPVDTGRAKAGTHISINMQPIGESGPGEHGISPFKLGDTVIIYNNVEYIVPLEYGHSKQAPQGMFRISFNDVVTHLGATIRSVARG